MEKILKTLKERLFKYVTINTQSNDENPECPSTEGQWILARLLVTELQNIGMENVTIDKNCYVMATLPSNVDHDVPIIGFLSHLDTAPDFSGNGVRPQIHENYNGKDIILHKEKNIILSPKEFPELNLYKGQTIITTDGTTLLGADDKAGIAEIMTAMEYLINHPEILHGEIRIAFTPDEEIGRGPHKFDVEKFDARWAYTIDASQIGELEDSNFNAAVATVTIEGKSVHPGYAKGILVNSQLIASNFISMLPPNRVPEKTEKYEGFIHLHKMEGNVAQTTLSYFIRDHDIENFQKGKQILRHIADTYNKRLDQKRIVIKIKNQYFNMKEIVDTVPHVIEIADKAIREVGIEPIRKAIRGGTDGSQLSFKGLPCPNIFGGGHNFHGPYEYIPLESMGKAVEVIVKIAELTAEKYA